MTKDVGLTRDAGYEMGARQTFGISPEATWDFVMSPEGVKLWLGALTQGSFEPDVPFETEDGVSGMLRVLQPYSHVRLAWKKPGWSGFSTLQVRVLPTAGGRSTIAFHQEKLASSAEREEMLSRWKGVLHALGQRIGSL